MAKLQAEIDKHHSNGGNSNDNSNDDGTTPVVFCLQEVSHDWAKQLHVFFAERGFHFITALYGRKFNGYMGIGTAYPIQYYKTLQVDICRLSDTRQGGWPRPREGGIDEPSLVSKTISKFVMAPWKKVRKSIEYIGLVSPLKSSSVDPWEKSQYRSNEFIAWNYWLSQLIKEPKKISLLLVNISNEKKIGF